MSTIDISPISTHGAWLADPEQGGRHLGIKLSAFELDRVKGREVIGPWVTAYLASDVVKAPLTKSHIAHAYTNSVAAAYREHLGVTDDHVTFDWLVDRELDEAAGKVVEQLARSEAITKWARGSRAPVLSHTAGTIRWAVTRAFPLYAHHDRVAEWTKAADDHGSKLDNDNRSTAQAVSEVNDMVGGWVHVGQNNVGSMLLSVPAEHVARFVEMLRQVTQ